jgi:hypothetical protein
MSGARVQVGASPGLVSSSREDRYQYALYSSPFVRVRPLALPQRCRMLRFALLRRRILRLEPTHHGVKVCRKFGQPRG